MSIPPQTSTIASHLPKAVGAAYAIGAARRHRPEHATLPDDAIVFIEPTAADEHGSLRLEWCEAARAACAPGLDWPVRASAKVLRDAGLLFDLVSGGMPVTVRIEQRSGEAAGAAAAKCGAEQPMLL